MIDWWGPIIHEYYGATEGMGFTACDTAEWLAHRGTVGGADGRPAHPGRRRQPAPKGTPGEIWFKTANPFVYFNDPERTALTRSADGTMTTVGDVGYVDDDGFLYLTDRSSFMIISGGVNIYPQECENLLVTHPRWPTRRCSACPTRTWARRSRRWCSRCRAWRRPGLRAGELIAFCQQHLAKHKCPRAVDFIDAAAAAHRQAVQEAAARQVLGRARVANRVRVDRVWLGCGAEPASAALACARREPVSPSNPTPNSADGASCTVGGARVLAAVPIRLYSAARTRVRWLQRGHPAMRARQGPSCIGASAVQKGSFGSNPGWHARPAAPALPWRGRTGPRCARPRRGA
jgi:hypothetical protein